jgi:hypothetical protein
MKLRKPTAMDKTFYYGTYKDIIEEFILDQTEKRGNIIYGSQAVRARLPSTYMTHKPNDWDIHSANPKRDAYEMARKLNKYYDCNMFYVLYKKRYRPTGERVDVYSVKNRAITPAYVKDDMYVPAIRYSINPEERKEISQYKSLTEIDYTPLEHAEHYEEVPVYAKDKPDIVGTIRVRPIETVYKHRKRMLRQKEYEFRRKKDISMLHDIERYHRHQKLKKTIEKGKIPIITVTGKKKFIPKFVKFGGKK